MCMSVCVWQREREREKAESEGESSRIFLCVPTEVVWLFCDSQRKSTGNAPRCDQSQLNFFRDKDRFFFFLRALTVHPYSTVMHLLVLISKAKYTRTHSVLFMWTQKKSANHSKTFFFFWLVFVFASYISIFSGQI